ncbi:MAG: 2Fe-2S iron-sulfur cluster binding domain-containing protein, partial [Chloroflexi bacterium]|nr:2Fe-2S iron-sulfur cluster binding domain-containing protein [Chloroflexota bacterium]
MTFDPDDDGTVRLHLQVNGRQRRVLVKSQHTLLQVLRDDLHLAGVREACGVGMCGACTVLID